MSESKFIFIVDDDEAARESVQALVASIPAQVQSFVSAEEFIAEYKQQRPACLITDQRMPGMSGIQLLEQLKASNIRLSIIVLTAYPDTKSTVRAMRCGAINLLEKPCSPQELWESIQQALELDAQNFKEENEQANAKKLINELSPKELVVLQMMVEGLTNKVIAKRLSYSTRTVESRRATIFTKLGVRSLPELTLIWLKSQAADSSTMAVPAVTSTLVRDSSESEER